MRKLLIFSLLLFPLVTTWGQKFEYWVETTPVDQFIVIEKGEERVVTSDRADNDQFIFKTDSPETSVRLHCAKCKDEISIIIFGKAENAYTEQIYLKMEKGQSNTVTLAQCFQQTKEKSLSEKFGSLVDAIKDFLQSARIGKIGKGGPFMRGENDAKDARPKYLTFLDADYSDYVSPEAFSVNFALKEGRRINSIYILRKPRTLVFLAGDNKVISELFDLSNRKRCEVADVLSSSKKEDSEIFQLNWQSISPYLNPPLKSGKRYQLGIELKGEGEEAGDAPYLFNFTISETLEKLIEKFANE